MKKRPSYDQWIHIVALLVLLTGSIFVVFAPKWFTGPASTAQFDFTETGNIGATIGGITAPLVGLTTAILMYLAFYAQFKANTKQWEIIEKNEYRKDENEALNIAWKLYDNLRKDIESERYSNLKSIVTDPKTTVYDHKDDIISYLNLLYLSYWKRQSN